MNAHKLRVEMHNGILTIPMPEDMKNNRFFEVFITADETPVKDKKQKGVLAKYANIAENLSNEQKEIMLQDIDNIRNEWDRDI